MSQEYAKPLPLTQPWTEAFWKAAKQHKLLIQKCNQCRSLIFYPRKYCPECWSADLTWQDARGRAKVYTFAVMRDMVEPKFMPDLPYVLAMVELEEGVLLATRIVEIEPDQVEIGLEVEVVFEDITPQFSLPLFRPVEERLRKPKPAGEDEAAGPRPGPGLGPETYETVKFELTGPNQAVCRITLDRPEKYNAINQRLARELIDAFRRVRDLAWVGVVVLSGAGEKAFCTGGDLDIFPSLAEHQRSLDWLAHEGLDVQRAITNCEKVVIGKVHGHCLAGGLELALCCDLLYAPESARFGLTEINMGILPGWGGTARLPRSMPVFRAREMVFSGRKDYSAREVYDMGLLTRVFPDGEFEAKVEAIISNIAAKKPIALRMGKEIMNRSVDGADIETALALERNGIQWLTYAPDIQQVMDQFRSRSGGLTQAQKQKNVEVEGKG
ncbi:MAG: enoyl-CoA hydratase-related protein [Thermodesulfobacteriota bacterium]